MIQSDARRTVTMTTKHAVKTRTEVLGCMSFRLKKLLKRKEKVDNWYELLTDDMETKKHMATRKTVAPSPGGQRENLSPASRLTAPPTPPPRGSTSRILTSASRMTSPPPTLPPRGPPCQSKSKQTPSIRSGIPQHQVTTVVLPRGSHGYGLTVRGSCPVKVGRVKELGTARQAGLHRGDCIVSLDGNNVSRSSSDSVASIIRHSDKQVVMELYCPHRDEEVKVNSSCSSSPGDRKVACGRQTSLDDAMLLPPDGVSDASIYSDARNRMDESHAQKSSSSASSSSCYHSNASSQDRINVSLDNKNNPCYHSNTSSLNQINISDSMFSFAGNDSDGNTFALDKTKDFLALNSIANRVSHGNTNTYDKLKTPALHNVPSNGYHSNSPMRNNFIITESLDKLATKWDRHSLRYKTNQCETKKKTKSCRKKVTPEVWNPDLSVIAHAQTDSIFQTSSDDFTFSTLEDATGSLTAILDRSIDSECLTWDTQCCQDTKGESLNDWLQGTPTRGRSVESLASSLEGDSPGVSTRPVQGSPAEIPPSSCLETNVSKMFMQHAQSHLVEVEENYVQQMHHGIQCYSRPLRHAVLSSDQHSAMFQNIEKLVAISQFNLRQLLEQTNTENDDVIASCVSGIYGSKLDILCEAYEHYASGIPRAMALLDTCRQQPRFQQYIQQLRTEGADFSIQEFLFSPIMHLVEVGEGLVDVLNHLHEENEHFTSLKNIVKGVKQTCQRIAEQQQRLLANNENTRPAEHNDVTVDPDVVALQNRLRFPPGIETMEIAVCDQHVLYMEEVYDSHQNEAPLIAVLLSDRLLLTQKTEGHLVVVQQPIYLCDILSFNFDLSHDMGFTLNVRDKMTGHVVGHVLLTGSLEKHCTWKVLLSQAMSRSRDRQTSF